MRLPKPGVKPEELKCKICQKTAKDQPNDMKQCSNANCPYPKPPEESS